jgi:hypothetical protein
MIDALKSEVDAHYPIRLQHYYPHAEVSLLTPAYNAGKYLDFLSFLPFNNISNAGVGSMLLGILEGKRFNIRSESRHGNINPLALTISELCNQHILFSFIILYISGKILHEA